jgi:hypothetical protein
MLEHARELGLVDHDDGSSTLARDVQLDLVVDDPVEPMCQLVADFSERNNLGHQDLQS